MLSIPHALASYLVLGEPGLSSYHEAALGDEKVRDLAGRVLVREDSELTRRTPTQWPARVTVRLRNGQELHNTVLLPSGEFDTNPFEDRTLAEKFRKLAPESFTNQSVNQMIDLLWQIETVPDMNPVIRLISEEK